MTTETHLPQTDPIEPIEPQWTNVRPSDFLSYRGGVGMVAWMLHRLTGLAVVGFLLWHVIDTSLLGWGPSAYNEAIGLYRTMGFRIGEILLFAAILYHGLNGLRIIVMDFWPRTNLAQKKLFYGAVVLCLVLFIPVLIFMINWMRK